MFSKLCLVVAACGFVLLGAAVPPASAQAAITGTAARAELRFLEGMSDHHQMALDMANDCLKKAQTPTVLKLCQNIVDAQSAEIKTMAGWLASWYQVDYKTVSMMKSDMSGAMAMPTTDQPGMMGMMAGLGKLQGHDYEIAFLESMLDHHDDAIHMANRILKVGQHPELLKLASDIIDAQTAETRLMNAMLVDLNK